MACLVYVEHSTTAYYATRTLKLAKGRKKKTDAAVWRCSMPGAAANRALGSIVDGL